MSQKAFSINRKLVFLVILVSVISISVTSFLSFNSAEKILRENTHDLLIGEASIRGVAITDLLESRTTDIEILAQNQQLVDLVQEINQSHGKENPPTNDKRESFLRIIDEYQTVIGYSINLEDVKIIGADGTVFFSLVDIPMEDAVNLSIEMPTNMKEPKIMFESKNNQAKKLVIFYPLLTEESLIEGENMEGFLIATMRTSDIDDILLNRSGLGETGEVYLVNKDHVLVSESRFLQDAAFTQTVDTLPVIRCFEDGQNISGETYEDYRGIPIFGASYCAEDLEFVLVAEMDTAETFGPVNSLQQEILVVGILVTIAIGLAAFVLANLISKPLTKLTNAVNEVADGNFDVRTNIRTQDEIGQLSSAFDSMAKRMQEALISIKQRDDVIRQQEEELLKFSDSEHNYCVGFVDIVNSTKITSSLEDSDTDKFYSIFLNSMASVITKFEGLVVKNLGDGLLFYFPRTKSVENTDSFRNVIDCCLAMVDANKEINEKMKKAKMPSLDYRISVAYGSVRIAKVFTSSVEDIFGSTVNKCSKINRLAQPNGIVIGNNLYEIVKSLDKHHEFKKIESEELLEKYGYETVYSVSRKHQNK
ncbi:MAG: HAMP domain-containing protein [Nitrosopumilus sp.]|nr:HAMP domain-containing protein [Nitrosopumilus sp.]